MLAFFMNSHGAENDTDFAKGNAGNKKNAGYSERFVDLPTIRERKKRPLTPEEEHQKRIAYRITAFLASWSEFSAFTW